MDFFNSQHLTPHDGYAHPFRGPGEFTYAALVPGMQEAPPSGTIVVSGEGVAEGEGTQFDVIFHWDADRRRFTPRQSDTKLALRPNDFVLFQFEAAIFGQPPCFILVRQNDDVECDSRALEMHDVFTHFFVDPGEYTYRLGDAEHRISVAGHKSMSAPEYDKQIRQPLLITVHEQSVDVPHGRAVTGQSVIWAVERVKGVHIESLTTAPKTT